MRVGIREREDTTVSRILSGLKLEIRGKVELLPYQDLNGLVQLCIKLEQQVLRNNVKSNHSSSYIKKYFEREGKQSEEERSKDKEKSREGTTTNTHTSDIKCYECLGRGHISS